MSEPRKDLADWLKDAQDALGEIAEGVGKGDPRLPWLEKQLASVVAQLIGIMTDIEAGMSVTDLGFSGNDEFEEMLEGLEVEIVKLKGLIRTLKEVGRG